MIRLRPRALGRWLIALTFALCIGADLLLARAQMPDGDTVQTLVEAAGALRHNPLLNHWMLGIDSFYFTDLPFMLLPTAIFGPRLWLLFVAPVLVLALLLLAAIMLVARAAPTGAPRWPGALAILLLLGLPFAPAQDLFLFPAIHIGTLTLCLLALLIVQPALSGQRLDRKLLPAFVLLVFMATASDPQAEVLFAGPLVLLLLLRLWLWPAMRSADDALVFVAVACAAVTGAFWPAFIAHHGGYATSQNFVPGFVAGAEQAAANASAVLQALQVLINARAVALAGISWPGVLATTRLFAGFAVLLLCLRIIWRAPRAPEAGVAHLLVLGALCLFGADVMSQGFAVAISGGPGAPGPATRYVAPGFVLLLIAAIIEAQRQPLRGIAGRGLAAVAMVCGIVTLATGTREVVAASRFDGVASVPEVSLIRWLEHRGLRYGVSDYWTAQMIEALSKGRIMTDGVIAEPPVLEPYRVVIDLSRIDAGRRPQFVVIPPPNSFGITTANITATYGAPAETDLFGPYKIVILPDK